MKDEGQKFNTKGLNLIKVLSNSIFCSISKRYTLSELVAFAQEFSFQRKSILMGDFPLLSDFAFKMVLLKRGVDVTTYFEGNNRLKDVMETKVKILKAIRNFELDVNQVIEVLELYETMDSEERKELFRGINIKDLRDDIVTSFNKKGIKINSDVKLKDKFCILAAEKIFLMKEERTGAIQRIYELANKVKPFHIVWINKTNIGA